MWTFGLLLGISLNKILICYFLTIAIIWPRSDVIWASLVGVVSIPHNNQCLLNTQNTQARISPHHILLLHRFIKTLDWPTTCLSWRSPWNNLCTEWRQCWHSTTARRPSGSASSKIGIFRWESLPCLGQVKSGRGQCSSCPDNSNSSLVCRYSWKAKFSVIIVQSYLVQEKEAFYFEIKNLHL